MIRVIVLALGLCIHAAIVRAQEVLPPDPGIESTIRNQFDAFRRGDLDTAWSFASPGIQGLFGTPENFGRMVEDGYPMVWAPGEVEFIDLHAFSGMIVQRVQVIDGNGQVHYLGYSMIRTEAGWQINGVRILQAPDVGA